jgi:hypothetical protein
MYRQFPLSATKKPSARVNRGAPLSDEPGGRAA